MIAQLEEIRESDSFTANVHRVRTKVKASSRTLRVSPQPAITELIIVSEEITPNIDGELRSSEYFDPLTIWEYSTISHKTEGSAQFNTLNFLDSEWEESAENRVARFALFCKGTTETSFKQLKLKFKGADVRNDSTVLEVHAHSARLSSLYSKIVEDQNCKSDFENFVEQYQQLAGRKNIAGKVEFAASLLASESVVKSVVSDYLQDKTVPKSCRFPTMGIMLKLLPRPNRLCTGNVNLIGASANPGPSPHMALPTDNKAHIRVSRGDLEANTLLQLIEIHLKKVK